MSNQTTNNDTITTSSNNNNNNNNNNRFLLPQSTGQASSSSSSSSSNNNNNSTLTNQQDHDENQLSVDTDFDSYWEEEARNPNRNRIRIGRQYQASVPALLKQDDKDDRKLEDLEVLSFCPKESVKVSDSELDHYFTVAKSLNLFANLVETRSLLGRDVTIADLNHIKRREGLSLASVIQPQPSRQANSIVSPSSSQQFIPITTTTTTITNTTTTTTSSSSPNKSPPNQAANCDSTKQIITPTTSSANEQQQSTNVIVDSYAFNQPLMKALSHFINLHHPCHHDSNCKKLLKDIPLEDESGPSVSIKSGNLRHGTTSATAVSSSKAGRSRSSLKQQNQLAKEESDSQQDDGDSSSQLPSFEEWTREEVELFSKAIEICGKNFSSIKKEFLPSKSVRSIVEYYYIGSRDVSDSKKKSQQPADTSDGCSSPEKSAANNNGQGGGSGGGGGPSSSSNKGSSSMTGPNSTTTTAASSSGRNNGTIADSNESEASSAPNKQYKTPTKSSKLSITEHDTRDSNGTSSSDKTKSTKNIDARLSVYNFDEEFKLDSPIKIESPRPGAEVKPLKAKPIIPNAALDSDPTNSDMGSLKFFMDGQLVLKLNACQEQQEGNEKCHWVQSGEKVMTGARQKRYTKRANDKSCTDSYQNGSHSNSVVSSYQDDDSKNEDLTNDDEDSKESSNSFTNLSHQQQRNRQFGSPTPKRQKVKTDTNQQQQPNPSPQPQQQLTSPLNYNKIAVNNRMKERIDMNLNNSNNINNINPVLNQGIPPWFQANHFAVAAALLSGLPFPPNAGNLIDNNTVPQQDPILNNNPISNNNSNTMLNNPNAKPMDLSLEHNLPKSLQRAPPASTGRLSRASKPKSNNNNR